jgi:hypothetical protein
MGPQHATTLNSYPTHANMIAAANGSTPAHLAYFSTNPVRKSNNKKKFQCFIFFCQIRVV